MRFSCIPAKDIRAGQVITYGVYDENEPFTVLVTSVEHTNESLTDEWYDSNKADTLDTITATQLRVWFTYLDGSGDDCVLLSGNESVTVHH